MSENIKQLQLFGEQIGKPQPGSVEQAQHLAIAISGLGLLNEYERQKTSGKIMTWTMEQQQEYGRLRQWFEALGKDNQQCLINQMHQLAKGIELIQMPKVFGS